MNARLTRAVTRLFPTARCSTPAEEILDQRMKFEKSTANFRRMDSNDAIMYRVAKPKVEMPRYRKDKAFQQIRIIRLSRKGSCFG
jgi:hypothetical protein